MRNEILLELELLKVFAREVTTRIESISRKLAEYESQPRTATAIRTTAPPGGVFYPQVQADAPQAIRISQDRPVPNEEFLDKVAAEELAKQKDIVAVDEAGKTTRIAVQRSTMADGLKHVKARKA